MRRTSFDILDLRHFSAHQLRPLLEDEGVRWRRRLDWNYSGAIEMLLEYLDDRVLPGFAALDGGRVIGYTFGVFEATKAILGDVYALSETEQPDNPLCETLLHHLIEMLQAAPGIDRIEAQLLMFPSGALNGPFLSRGFRATPRLFMTCATDQVLRAQPMQSSATGLNLIAPGAERIAPWRPELYDAAAELIYRCYVHHIDATINDQYTSVNGSRRFLHNVVRFPGCGVFDGRHSLVLHAEAPGALDGLLLCSRVDTGVAHITQLCLSPAARGRGMARLMMERCAAELRADGVTRLQLTVTEANSSACRLYRSMGFEVRHRFDAMAWNDPDH